MEYSLVEYWDARYEDERCGPNGETPHEWSPKSDELLPFLQRHLPETPTQPQLLQLGCGTSALTAELFHLGYHHQSSIDFSAAAIETMRTRYADLGPGLGWRVMDMRQMDFPDQSFDIVIDKGALDSMMNRPSYDPTPQEKYNIGACVDEVVRLLKPGGRWLHVTFIAPHFLKSLLVREGVWKIDVEKLSDGLFCGYVMRKSPPAQPRGDPFARQQGNP